MMKRILNRNIVIFAFLFVLISSGLGAKTLSSNFYLKFTKPPHDEFYFSDPESANTAKPGSYPSSLIFPAANLAQSAEGYPSEQFLGISYNLETTNILRVYCNSQADHQGSFRLGRTGDISSGLNYKVEVFKTYNDATNKTSEAPAPDSTAPDDVTQPVYTFNGPTPEDSTGATQLQTVVLRMTLVSPNRAEDGSYVPYTDGHYTGFIVMELSAT